MRWSRAPGVGELQRAARCNFLIKSHKLFYVPQEFEIKSNFMFSTRSMQMYIFRADSFSLLHCCHSAPSRFTPRVNTFNLHHLIYMHIRIMYMCTQGGHVGRAPLSRLNFEWFAAPLYVPFAETSIKSWRSDEKEKRYQLEN